MPKFATAYITFFDNVMSMNIIEAASEMDALRSVLISSDIELEGDEKTPDDLKQLAFDCDSMVGAIQIGE